MECDDTCQTCSGSGDSKCLNCFTGRFFFEGKCLVTCPDGYYKDTSVNQCKICHAECLTCS